MARDQHEQHDGWLWSDDDLPLLCRKVSAYPKKYGATAK